jgi:hypothetical protein
MFYQQQPEGGRDEKDEEKMQKVSKLSFLWVLLIVGRHNEKF